MSRTRYSCSEREIRFKNAAHAAKVEPPPANRLHSRLGGPLIGATVVALGMPMRGAFMPATGGGTDESFRGLVLQLRGRLGLTQRELAARLDVHAHSIQAWEAGTSYPGAASLRALIVAAVQAGAFTPGHEMAEASSLWDSVTRDSPRLRTPFDSVWLDGILRAANT